MSQPSRSMRLLGFPRFTLMHSKSLSQLRCGTSPPRGGNIPGSGTSHCDHSKKIFWRVTPVVRGLKSDAFHLFDNGVEQSINSFQEADFPAVEMTNHWYFTPTTDGTWGTFQPFNDVDFPLASYLIGYVPTIGPSECHTIRVVVEGLEAQVNRHGYCALKDSGLADIDAVAGKKLGEKMRVFANSTAHGSIKVSMQPFAFWSSGTLRLAREASPTGGPADQPETDLTYVVEVHDSKAPAALQIAVGFKFPELAWYFLVEGCGCIRSRNNLQKEW